MNKPYIAAVLVAISLAFSVSLVAQEIVSNDYQLADKRILTEYRIARANCNSLTGNERSLCLKRAKAELIRAQSVAKAQPDIPPLDAISADVSTATMIRMYYGK